MCSGRLRSPEDLRQELRLFILMKEAPSGHFVACAEIPPARCERRKPKSRKPELMEPLGHRRDSLVPEGRESNSDLGEGRYPPGVFS